SHPVNGTTKPLRIQTTNYIRNQVSSKTLLTLKMQFLTRNHSSWLLKTLLLTDSTMHSLLLSVLPNYSVNHNIKKYKSKGVFNMTNKINFKQPINQLNFVLHAHVIPSVEMHSDTVDVLNNIGQQFDTPINMSSPAGNIDQEIILFESADHLDVHIQNLEIEMEIMQDEDVNSQSVTDIIAVIKQLESFKSAIAEKLHGLKSAYRRVS